jgi:indolepyruvate ferredoxin oxidoreductase beta subunit
VIAALGGEGGGVLGNWIADMANRHGYLSQTTSVPGVAQRTGATIYYIEIFPREEAEQAGKVPVLSMFPTPGDVDIVICSEIVEAGRMIQRGFVTPDRTTLISSTHRTYGITEKAAMGNGIVDKEAIAAVARARAMRFIGFDMQAIARRHDSVINAALFGALAGSDTLPFGREAFEETVRLGRIAVDSNLQTFAASYELVTTAPGSGVGIFEPEGDAEKGAFSLPAGTTTEGRALLARIAGFPPVLHETLFLGVNKLVQYQDYRYAGDYLDRLEGFLAAERGGGCVLTLELARFLALWMAFEDLPRVAQLKISESRFNRFRDEVRAEPGQPVRIVEFLHPRVEEFCGVLPAPLGRFCLNSPLLSRLLGLFARPRHLRTDSVLGYTGLYLVAKLRRLRRSSLIFAQEQQHMEQWLDSVRRVAAEDYAAAVELARCGRLIKGYGSTRERGTASLQRILAVQERAGELPADAIAELREAALEDEEGLALAAATARFA